jgi:hypothetical protein
VAPVGRHRKKVASSDSGPLARPSLSPVTFHTPLVDTIMLNLLTLEAVGACLPKPVADTLSRLGLMVSPKFIEDPNMSTLVQI